MKRSAGGEIAGEAAGETAAAMPEAPQCVTTAILSTQQDRAHETAAGEIFQESAGETAAMPEAPQCVTTAISTPQDQACEATAGGIVQEYEWLEQRKWVEHTGELYSRHAFGKFMRETEELQEIIRAHEARIVFLENQNAELESANIEITTQLRVHHRLAVITAKSESAAEPQAAGNVLPPPGTPITTTTSESPPAFKTPPALQAKPPFVPGASIHALVADLRPMVSGNKIFNAESVQAALVANGYGAVHGNLVVAKHGNLRVVPEKAPPPPKGPPSLRQYPNKGPVYKMPPPKKQQQYHKVSASSSSSDLGFRCNECGKLMIDPIWTTQLVPENMMNGRPCCSIECLNSYCEAKLGETMNAYSLLWAAQCNLAARPQ